MLGRDPSTRSQVARIGAHSLWAKTSNPAAITAAGRAAFLDRFEREVDPDGTLHPEERARRATSAKKAYFAKLALKSAQARAGRKSRTKVGPAEGEASGG